MFHKISEDIANTPMGKSPNEEKYTRRVSKWLVIFLLLGVIIGSLITVVVIKF